MSREIDALVAEYVMGWTWKNIPTRVNDVVGMVKGNKALTPKCFNFHRERPDTGWWDVYTSLPSYSTNIAAAYQVIEHVNLLLFTVDRENCCGVRYDARCYNKDDLSDKVNVTASTAPLAICLAILKFMGIDIKQFDRGLR